MQIHVVDSSFGFVKVRFVTVLVLHKKSEYEFSTVFLDSHATILQGPKQYMAVFRSPQTAKRVVLSIVLLFHVLLGSNML